MDTFVVNVVKLTNSLIRISRDSALERSIYQALAEQLSLLHGADLDEMFHQRTPQGVQVLVTVRSQHTISPKLVTTIESAIESSLNEPVDLGYRNEWARYNPGTGPESSVLLRARLHQC